MIFCTQYFACSTPERQQEIDRCLELNLSNRLFERAVIWLEPQAPALPSSLIPIEIIPLDRRLTYSDWLQLVRRHPGTVVLLANSDISFDGSIETLPRWLGDPGIALALSRHELDRGAGAVLRASPHWSQDAWALRADAPMDASLLSASAIPLGVPGCDNRFAHVLWSHGFQLANPCHEIRALHHQRQGPNDYNRVHERLFGACCYVHPSLAPGDAAELEHTLWTRSPETSGGITLQLEGEQIARLAYGLHPRPPGSDFVMRQHLAPLLERGRPLSSLEVRALGPPQDHAVGPDSDLSLPPLADRLLLPVEPLSRGVVRLELRRPTPLLALALRTGGRPLRGDLLIESCGDSSIWQTWRPLLPGPEIDGAPSGLSILGPPSGDPVRQLRLQWLRQGPQSQADPVLQPDAGWPSQLELSLVASAPLPGVSREPLTPMQRLQIRQLLGRSALLDQRQGLLAWDQPDATEEQAWLLHQDSREPACSSQASVDVYCGMPWASFAARGRAPRHLIAAIGERHGAAASLLAGVGVHLRVHSVCQHSRWQDQLPLFEAAGITDLWLPHKVPGLDQVGPLRLHPWPSLVPPSTLVMAGAQRSHRLCPGGSGWDPLAFWRALGEGRLLALLPPWPELPPLPAEVGTDVQGWSDVVLFAPGAAPDAVTASLAALSAAEWERRTSAGRMLHRLFSGLRCFPDHGQDTILVDP